jgi:hypothetical protein
MKTHVLDEAPPGERMLSDTSCPDVAQTSGVSDPTRIESMDARLSSSGIRAHSASRSVQGYL